jgi:hypothetical protein
MKKKLTLENILLSIAVLTIIAALAHPYFIKYIILKDAEFSQLGTVGDWFGGLSGPLIGLSSFILVYLAFRLQIKQNESQRIEFDKQNKILSLQRFETSFFQLLTFHHEIVQALWIHYSYISNREIIDKPKEGFEGETVKVLRETKSGEQADKREYFSTVYLMMQNNLKEINKKSIGLSKDMKASFSYKESVAIENYKTVFNIEQASLGHYFRHLYHILKYIHKTDLITKEEKKDYAALVRAQLSAYELVLLLYNCLVEDLGYPKFKFLVDEYDLLQNMNRNLLLDDKDFVIFSNKKLTQDCLN